MADNFRDVRGAAYWRERLDRAQVEHVSTLDKITEALTEYESAMRLIGGCCEGWCCITGKNTGMVTNGGCHCARTLQDDKMAIRRFTLHARKLADAITAALNPKSQ